MKKYLFTIIMCSVLPLVVFATADGPDYWKVQKVKSDDVLNIRQKPNWRSKKMGEIPYDGRCIQNLGCSGGLTLSESMNLSKSEKKKILRKRPRWCQVNYQHISGWVSGNYLAEDDQCDGNLPKNFGLKDNTAEKSFDNVMNQFADALNQKNYQKITKTLIDPTIGIYMLYNLGTATRPYHFQSFGEFMKNSHKIHFSGKKKITLGEFFFGGSKNSCDLKIEKLPDFCEPEKEGCFAEKPANYRSLGSAFFAEQFFGDSQDQTNQEIEKKEDVKQARRIDKTIQRVVYFSGSRLGFSFKNNRWYLVILDLSDCSA